MGGMFRPGEGPKALEENLEEQRRLNPKQPYFLYVPERITIGSEVQRLYLGPYPWIEAQGFRGIYDHCPPGNSCGSGRGFPFLSNGPVPDDISWWFEKRVARKKLEEYCRQTREVSNPGGLLIDERFVQVLLDEGAVPENHMIEMPVFRADDPDEICRIWLFDPPVGPEIIDYSGTQAFWEWEESQGYWYSTSANKHDKESILPGVDIKIVREKNNSSQIFIDKGLLRKLEAAGVENVEFGDFYAVYHGSNYDRI